MIKGERADGSHSVDINLDFRPETYWPPATAKHSRTKGTYAVEDLKLNKTFFGLHSQIRSGEDLPDFLETEVEITRLRLGQTVHEEVTSIRARRVGSRIVYRIVDELVEEWGGEIKVRPRSSSHPLTLRQLIRLIDTAEIPDEDRIGLVIPTWELRLSMVGKDPQSLRDWVVISSVFYPQLKIYYDRVFLQWAKSGCLFVAATLQ